MTDERYIVRGGQRLSGRVRVSGAKNAILPALAATLLAGGTFTLRDVPDLRDVAVMGEILSRLGGRIAGGLDAKTGRRVLSVSTDRVDVHEVHEDLTREMRSSIFLMGPLLARLGKVRVAYPGGCAIGPRPIDLHLRGLEALGTRLRERYGYIDAETSGLLGADVYLEFPSVGATENVMMAAVLARGQTTIRNAAKEPEIVDLQNFLNGMGAKVWGAGTDVIRIEGVAQLSACEHTVIPDRIEAGTFLIAGAMTRGQITVENAVPEHLTAVVAKLREAGAEIETERDRIHLAMSGRPRATDLRTLPYPGFPTDLQPPMMAMTCVASGTSIITETIFESRFKQAEELRRMGAEIRTDGRTAVVKGREMLSGAFVDSPALREGMSLVLAGLVAEGTTTVASIHHIDRGYECLDEKLRALGADVWRAGAARPGMSADRAQGAGG